MAFLTARNPTAGRRILHAVIGLLLAALLLTGTQPASGSDELLPREYQIKAAFLYNFTKFIEWPPRSFSDPAASIVVGVLGPPEFATALERVVQYRTVNGRGIQVRRIQTVEEAAMAHALFVSATQDAQWAQLHVALAGRPIVTVGESAASAGIGTITFVLQDDKVRFEIDMDVAEQAGLHISAQLLKLSISNRRGVSPRQ